MDESIAAAIKIDVRFTVCSSDSSGAVSVIAFLFTLLYFRIGECLHP